MNEERNEQKYLLPVKVAVTGHHAYEAQRFFRNNPRSYGKAGLFATAAAFGVYEIAKDVQNQSLKK